MQSIEATREFLRNTKALPARHADAPEVLARIMRLSIGEWSEADVRAEIIHPLIRIGTDATRRATFRLIARRPWKSSAATKRSTTI